MAKIRVLRLLEYTYDSVESFQEDAKKWGVPLNGYAMKPSAQIKSATLPLDVLPDVPNAPHDAGDDVRASVHGTQSRGDAGFFCICGKRFETNAELAAHIVNPSYEDGIHPDRPCAHCGHTRMYHAYGRDCSFGACVCTMFSLPAGK